jgi:uncharacterized damage-inducible protein DinB
MQKQFGYKAWANAEMLDALALIDASQYPDQWKLAVRLMNHTYVVDRIFAAHLGGESHAFQGTNTPETPTLEQLCERIAASDTWYRDYTGRLDPAALQESISFTFTDGERGSMTREEILFHVLAHGGYHRGNVGMVLTSCGIDRPSDTFTRFLHASEPGRRDGIV